MDEARKCIRGHNDQTLTMFFSNLVLFISVRYPSWLLSSNGPHLGGERQAARKGGNSLFKVHQHWGAPPPTVARPPDMGALWHQITCYRSPVYRPRHQIVYNRLISRCQDRKKVSPFSDQDYQWAKILSLKDYISSAMKALNTRINKIVQIPQLTPFLLTWGPSTGYFYILKFVNMISVNLAEIFL